MKKEAENTVDGARPHPGEAGWVECYASARQEPPQIQRYPAHVSAECQEKDDVHLDDLQVCEGWIYSDDQESEEGGCGEGVHCEAETLSFGWREVRCGESAEPLQVEANANAYSVEVGVSCECTTSHASGCWFSGS